jgi:hypothetical protein
LIIAIMSETTGTGEKVPATAASTTADTAPSSAFIPTGDAVNFALFPIQSTIAAVDTADKNPAAPAATAEQKQIHDEGIAHINAKLDETIVPADATASTSAALPTEPPASNPGAEDPSGGISAGAGGVSGAAHKDVPNPNTTATGATGPNNEKRKSVIGTFKGFLGLDKRSKSNTAAADDTYVGAATAAVTAAAASVTATAAAATETVQQYTGTAATTTTEEKKDIGYEPSTAANTEPIAAAGTTVAEPAAQPTDKVTTEEVAESADPTSKKADVENEVNTDGAANKPPQEASGNPATRTNPDAIPTAGGKKVGEDTWGESEVIPEVPDVKEEGKFGTTFSYVGMP